MEKHDIKVRELKSKSYKYIDVDEKEVIGIGKFFGKKIELFL